jgi:ATP-dependent DNA helicase DinG
MIQTPRDLGLNLEAWWPGQPAAIDWLRSFISPNQILVAPTGAGKTAIKLALARLEDLVTYSLTSAKKLQDQERKTFPLIHVVKGQIEYPCPVLDNKVTVAEAPCQTGWHCIAKASCPYYRDKALVPKKQITSMNYAMYLTDRRYVEPGFPTPQVLICDEAHNIEEELSRARTITFRTSASQELGIPKCPSLFPAIQTWAAKQYGPLIKAQGALEARIQDKQAVPEADKLQLKRLRRMTTDLAAVIAITDAPNWVVEEADRSKVVLMPVFVRQYGPDLFGGVTRRIFTSATIPDVDYFADCLGISPGDYASMEMPSTFPPENRPILIDPISEPLNKGTEYPGSSAWAAMVGRIDTILEMNPHSKGLIHAGSYARQQEIVTNSRYRSRMWAPTTAVRDQDLDHWRQEPGPKVMVHPGIYEGVDLPGDLNEFQIIPKVKFPYLGSAKVQARIKEDPRYIPAQVGLYLAQATGRAARSPEDQGRTYILDRAIMPFLQRHGDYLPRWWHEAVHFRPGLK